MQVDPPASTPTHAQPTVAPGPPPSSAHPCLTFTSGGLDRTLGRQRADVHAFLVRNGLGGTLVDDVVLVMSELLANAHEASGTDSEVQVRVAVSPVLVTVEVVNDRPRRRIDPVRLAAPRMPDADQERGRGLAVVASLSTRLAIEPTDRATAVRAELLRT